MRKKLIILIIVFSALSASVMAGFLWHRAITPGKKICYVAADSALYIFDVSNPSKPALLGSSGVAARDVRVVNNIAYVAGGSALSLLDVTDPYNPTLRGYTWIYNAMGVDVVGNIAYVAGDYGVYCVDVTNPSNPQLLGSSFVDNAENVMGGRRAVEGLKVDVVGKVAYVVSNFYSYIFDVTDTSNPLVLATTVGGIGDIQVVDNVLYISNINGLYIVDVSNPSNPVWLSRYSPGDSVSSIWGLHVVNGIAYLADRYLGLHMVDVTNPDNPVLLSSYRGNMSSPTGVYVVDNIAYIADESSTGLWIVDVTNPSMPSLLGSHYTISTAREVYVTN